MLTVSEVRNYYRTRKAHFAQEAERCKGFGQSTDSRMLFNHLCKHIVGSQQNWGRVAKVVDKLDGSGILWKGDTKEIGGALKECGLRFHKKRGQWLHEARQQLYSDEQNPDILTLVRKLRQLSEEDPIRARDTLAGKRSETDIPRIKGIGMKWASHFLRDLGLADNKLVILDSRVISALEELGVTDLLSKGLTPNLYLDVERTVKKWAGGNLPEIPLDHLDWVLWEMKRGTATPQPQ